MFGTPYVAALKTRCGLSDFSSEGAANEVGCVGSSRDSFAEVRGPRRQKRDVETLGDLVADVTRLRHHLARRRPRLDASVQRVQAPREIRALRAGLLAQLLRRFLDEVLLLGELVGRKHLTVGADRSRVIASHVVEERH